MRFSYQARTEEGEIQTGFVEASSREAALSVLQRYGLYVTYLTQLKEPFWQRRIEFFREASKGDIVAFTRQLSIMLKSEIPVVESLESVVRQTKKMGFQEKILKIAEMVEGGSTLSQAFSNFPEIFSPFYVGMLKSGEASGRIPESLEYLADHLEREQDFISKIITSIIYPAFILAVFFLVLFLMAIFLVPQFAEIFAGIELPFLTRLVLGAADFLKRSWWILFLLFSGLGFSIFFSLKSEEGRKFLDKFSLDLPIFSDFLKKIYLSRFSLNLSTLIAGGVPITQALEITGDVVGNSVYKEIILKTRDGVRAGESISSVLASYPEVFPPLFLQMTIVGERAGHLEKTLQNVFTFYQKEVDRALDTFVKFLEPMLIIFLGLLVALLAVSLFLPIFQKGLII